MSSKKALDCVLLKDNNRALVARSGTEINSRACLCVLQGPRHNTRCWFSIQCFIFLLIFCQETPKQGSVPTNRWSEPSLTSLSAVSFPRTTAPTGTQYSPTVCRVETAFNAFWHCRTKRRPIRSLVGTRVLLISYREKCSRFKSSEMYAVSTGRQFPTFRRNKVLLFSRCSRRPLGPEEKPNTSLRNITARTLTLKTPN